ncbi:MAG: transglutaminase-like cysteine peptidase [Proteobacteria bacterium]|nr:transglutaminase-like cysteine peptidase [Pseudomonadota bacterium]
MRIPAKLKKWMLHAALGWAAAALLLSAWTSTASLAAGPYPELFGTREIVSQNLKAFPKWRGMLKRYFKATEIPEGSCDARTFNTCHLEAWQAFLDSTRHLSSTSRRQQIETVNRYLNGVRYISDIRNWNVEDYWATPQQFFIHDGDCEDFAISKYMSLRALGYTVEELRIVVVEDLNLKVGHAILAVYLGGESYILDNRQCHVWTPPVLQGEN